MQLQVGQKAPEFALPAQDGKVRKLADYKGQWVLVYFYPKDDTPGCTTEACGFRDNLPRFQGAKVTILGISADSVESHKKFEEKYGLPFTLLSDVDKSTIQAYGVWQENGIARTSFLVGPEGNIVKIYEKVKPENHPEQVLEDLKTVS